MPQGMRSGKARADAVIRWSPSVRAFSAKRNGADRIEICYIHFMPKAKRSGTKAKKKGGFVVGRDSFGKISAVEGIRLTPTMKKRATDAEREGLSAEEYRETIARAYRKA
jgi:hypothetical protein